MEPSELQYVLALQHVPSLGDASAKKLIRKLGSAEAIFKEKKSRLLKVEGIGDFRLRGLYDPVHLRAAEKEIAFMDKNRISWSFFMDKDYPERLKHCYDGPILFFKRGKMDLEKRKVISIVGTRNATGHGKAFCEQFINDLAPLDPVVISGFAFGIDITAQKAAMRNGLQTIGCLAHGLNQIYPRVHQKYVGMVEENGGFITDFWSSDSFERTNFLKRNRIIAGLSEATIVVESAEKGGSLVTADIANSYNREVFAVPGRPTDLQSKGCNELIKHQKAHVLTSAADLVFMLNWQLEEKARVVQKQLFVELDESETILYQFLQENGKEQLDLIALKCKFPTFKTASLLLNMELKGVVKPLPGKLFEIA